MKRIQIAYPLDSSGLIEKDYIEESKFMSYQGFMISGKIQNNIDGLIYRGHKIWKPEDCLQHSKIYQGWEEVKKTSYMNEYYPIIKEATIPTIFIENIDYQLIQDISSKKSWDKIFIKSPSRSLFAYGDFTSVWPDTSIEEMNILFNEIGVTGPFAIRKFIDDPEIFYNEQRYWILNGNAYHPSGEIPDFVKEYGKKMYEFSGSHYFTMDVAGDYIVEINPGESSDRGGDNPLDWFCEIFAKEFLHK